MSWVDSEFHRRRNSHPLLATSASRSTPGASLSDPHIVSTPNSSKQSGGTRGAAGQDRQSTDAISDDWVHEILETERRATKAETELELLKVQLKELQDELHSAKGDLNYERSLVNRLKDQLRGND